MDHSSDRRWLSLSRYLVNKDINPAHPRLPAFKGDGWQSREIKQESLEKILIEFGYAINGCRLGELTWDGVTDCEPHQNSGYQRLIRENVQDVHLVGLDFDNDTAELTPIEDAVHDPILSTAALGYTSSSNHKVPQDKYRLVWWLPEPMTPEEADSLLAKMLKLWPGVDPQCGNCNRIWYGHRDGEVFIRNDGATLPVQEILDRYEIEVDDEDVSRITNTGLGISGSDGEYIVGFHDHFCDEVGMAVAALHYIPSRGKPGKSQSYAASMATIAGLIDHFGPELAMDIIDKADWEGDYWDIRKSQLNPITKMVERNRKSNNPKRATFGSVLKRAKSYGMSSREIGSFRKQF